MCGISGTIFNRNFNKGIEVSVNELEILLQRVVEGEASADELLNLSWKFKSNINFLRYFYSKAERDEVKELSDKIASHSEIVLKKIRSINKDKFPQQFVKMYSDYEKLLDASWFLGSEIKKLFEGIRMLNPGKELSQSSVIFYKSVQTVISSMDNRLEIRGRDSLGFSIQVLLDDAMDISLIKSQVSEDKSETIIFHKSPSKNCLNFTFKTANRVGSLGDNCNIIISKIKACKILHNLIEKEVVISSTIVSHTRWASVGEVNISNCHPISNLGINLDSPQPIVFASLNGDIHNYKSLISSSDTDVSKLDPECTTDCLSIPLHLSGFDLSNTEDQIFAFNSLQGSFAVAVQDFANPNRILLSSKGSQGLYVGVSYDSIMFASDVYGLVESCKYFKSISSGSLLSIFTNDKPYGTDFKISIHSMKDSSISNIGKKELQTTNITTRDIDRRDYEHFLLKEIHETNDIVQRTILGYLQSEKLTNKTNYGDSIICDESQVPQKIIDKLVDGKIKNVIVTGMGTCYTAAVAISGYMRNLLSEFIHEINVQPHVASEGSGFYLRSKMSDTLVVVIAQSGTTVDTNVYVQMAKDRGASSIAIANKREGDVTFIVDGTLYIGSGRDIEIAVPSTKTYTAQVILGYILSLYLACRLNKGGIHNDVIKKNIENLRMVPKIITDTFTYLDGIGSRSFLGNFPLKNKSWYLAYDNSPNSVCAMEIRIKYSEGCYHSLPYMHLNDIINLQVKNSFITYITDRDLSEVEEDLLDLSVRNHLVVVSSNFKSFESSELTNNSKIEIVSIPKVDDSYSFIPTTIAGQLISYYIAVELDKRKFQFSNIKNSVLADNMLEQAWKTFESELKEGKFEQGFSDVQISSIKVLYQKYRTSEINRTDLLEELHSLYDFSRRPIDTIKHQAKTLTVGAVRQKNNNLGHVTTFSNGVEDDILSGISINLETISNYLDLIEFAPKQYNNKSNFIFLDNLDESYGYLVVNFLNNFSNKYNLDKEFNLAHHYDVRRLMANNLENPILIGDSRSNKFSDLSFSNFSEFYSSSEIEQLCNLTKYDSCNLSLRVLLHISKISLGLLDNRDNFAEHKEYLKSQYHNLLKSFSFIQQSPSIKQNINRSVELIKLKENFKILGSGVNYNSAKYVSKKIIKQTGKAFAFDVLENHKHIDISAEALCFVLIHNIWRQGYQNDVLPEFEKLMSHENIPIVVTHSGDNRFDDITMRINMGRDKFEILTIPVFKFPKIDEDFAFFLNNFFFEYLLENY